MPMELAGKKVAVVGLGRSGVAAARFCLSRGATVLGTDTRTESELGAAAAALADLGLELVLGTHEGVPWEDLDLVVVSPGVPVFKGLIEAARAGVPVLGELELASRFVTAPIVAIGGTNGKSTVTTATARLFEAAGLRVFAGGNLGTPLTEAIPGAPGAASAEPYDVLVVEVSSFQLERAPKFRPRVSVLLNITEDHLDRYGSFQDYADAKGNAFENQTPEDVAIIPAGDAQCLRQARRGKGRVLTFQVAGGPDADYGIALDPEAPAVLEVSGNNRFSLIGADFHGAHNVSNAAAAVAAARALAVPEAAIERGLRDFRALGHRMALVRELSGVRYYDDSKATNVGAAVTALMGLLEPKAVLIAGGRDKLGSYGPLVTALRAKGRAVVLIGEAADAIAEAVGRAVPVVRAASMGEAVSRAQALAQPGDAVLLSPACASFDMFKGYADRGDRFADAVRRLEPGRPA